MADYVSPVWGWTALPPDKYKIHIKEVCWSDKLLHLSLSDFRQTETMNWNIESDQFHLCLSSQSWILRKLLPQGVRPTTHLLALFMSVMSGLQRVYGQCEPAGIHYCDTAGRLAAGRSVSYDNWECDRGRVSPRSPAAPHCNNRGHTVSFH